MDRLPQHDHPASCDCGRCVFHALQRVRMELAVEREASIGWRIATAILGVVVVLGIVGLLLMQNSCSMPEYVDSSADARATDSGPARDVVLGSDRDASGDGGSDGALVGDAGPETDSGLRVDAPEDSPPPPQDVLVVADGSTCGTAYQFSCLDRCAPGTFCAQSETSTGTCDWCMPDTAGCGQSGQPACWCDGHVDPTSHPTCCAVGLTATPIPGTPRVTCLAH